MAGQYSHRQFFRQTPNALLHRYFEHKAITYNVDFTTVKENDGDTLFNALIALEDGEQTIVEADFKAINALACEAGIQALVDESAYFSDEDFVAEIAVIEGFHAKALWAFIEKPDYWHGAAMFLHADNVSASSWKKRINLPQITHDIEDEAIDALSIAISDYFYKKEARGKHCKIETYKRHEKDYLFAYPEDHAKSDVEWVSDSLTSRAFHPAFELIFVYCAKEGSLDIYAPKNTKAVEELQKLFAKHILNVDSLADGKIDKRVYELDSVAEPNFEFTIAAESGIESAVVTHLRLTLNTQPRKRITLEADTKKSANAVYDLLGELDLPDYFITQVGVKVTFTAQGNQRATSKRFNITYPNNCALHHEGKDLKIREMLIGSGIEPQNNIVSE
jgi:hypothetical protein